MLRGFASVVLASLGVVLALGLLAFGALGIWGLIADYQDNFQDRTVPIRFVVMVMIGFGAGGWVLFRSLRALAKHGRTSRGFPIEPQKPAPEVKAVMNDE